MLIRPTRRELVTGLGATALLRPQTPFAASKPKQLCGTIASAPPGPICSPTRNPLNMVQFNGVAFGLALPNVNMFGSAQFPYLLHSSWRCTPPGPGAVTGCDLSTNYTEFWSISTTGNFASGENVAIQLYTTGNVKVYDATFVPSPSALWNVLVSVDMIRQIVQLYVNDVAVTPTSGGWIGSGLFTSLVCCWSYAFDVGSIGGEFAAISEVWEANPPSFYDLSVVGNRRKFIDSAKNPVDLGASGQNPLGYTPPLYMVAPSAANDFIVNRGSAGGTFTINLSQSDTSVPPLTFQAPGTCPCPT